MRQADSGGSGRQRSAQSAQRERTLAAVALRRRTGSNSTAVEPAGTRRRLGRPQPVWRRLGVGFWTALGWLALVTTLAVLAPALPFSDPTEVGVSGPREGPSSEAWFGTDSLGRDVFSRTVYGARISLSVGAFAIVFGMVLGGGLGIVAGYFGGRIDQIIGFVFFVLLSFPALVLAILITATLERSLLVVSLTLGILSVAPVGRLSRATSLVFAKREFVAAARVIGARHGRVIVRELLPNVLIPMAALTLLGMAITVVAEGALAFLGLSVAGDDAISWGKMIVDGAGIRDLQKSPNVALFPIATMFCTVLALNYCGDRVRECFDVRELAF